MVLDLGVHHCGGHPQGATVPLPKVTAALSLFILLYFVPGPIPSARLIVPAKLVDALHL